MLTMGLPFPGAAPPFTKKNQTAPTTFPNEFTPASAPAIPKGPIAKPAVVSEKIVKPMALPKTRTAFHVNTAIPRGHIVSGKLLR
jgi:hypothetical protein